MNSAQHTPGPWAAYCNDLSEGELRPVGDSGVRYWDVNPDQSERYRGAICNVHAAEHIGGISLAERDANAHLIAAAPELFNELADLVDWLDENRRAIEGEFHMDDLLADARAALAKARGEA